MGTIEIGINVVAFTLSVAGIYLTTNTDKKTLGCVIGVAASILNIYLTREGPIAVFALSWVCLVLYAKPLVALVISSQSRNSAK